MEDAALMVIVDNGESRTRSHNGSARGGGMSDANVHDRKVFVTASQRSSEPHLNALPEHPAPKQNQLTTRDVSGPIAQRLDGSFLSEASSPVISKPCSRLACVVATYCVY